MPNRIQRPTAARLGSTLGLVAAATMLLAACSSSKSATPKAASSQPPATTTQNASSTPASSSASGGGSCSEFKPGEGGIVQVFCDGTADAKITVGSTTKELTGGSCAEQSGQLAINFGAVAGPDFPSGTAKPDYLGVLIDQSTKAPGAFTVHIDGAGGIIVGATATVSADNKSVQLAGKLLSGGDAVTADITC